MMRPRLTRIDVEVLDLDDEGLDAATIAIVLGRSPDEVSAALRRHADRRRAGSWRDAA